MEQYKEYKDSGVEWIGEIPIEWDVKKIKHYFYVKGRVGWKGLKSSEFLFEGFSYLVTGTDFKDGKIDWRSCYYIDKGRYEEDPYIQLHEQDLLITKDGTIGKLAIIDELDKPACLNSGIFVVRSMSRDLATRYLYWVLMSNVFTQFNNYTSYGSTIQHLYQNIFVEFSFACPNLEEQTAIVNFLDRKISEIDALIAQKERLLELYKEEKTAIIKHAVTKGIERNTELKDSGVEWIGKIPARWEVKKIRQFTNILTGATPKSTEERYWNGDIFWVTTDDLGKLKTKYIIDTKRKLSKDGFEKSGTYLAPKGSIVLSTRAPIGHVGILKIEACSNQGCKTLVSNDKYNSEFVYYFLCAGKAFLSSLGTGTTFLELSTQSLKDTLVVFPDIQQQTVIADFLDCKVAEIDTKIARTQRILELQEEYRTTLISDVVTGKIKVSHLAREAE